MHPYPYHLNGKLSFPLILSYPILPSIPNTKRSLLSFQTLVTKHSIDPYLQFLTHSCRIQNPSLFLRPKPCLFACFSTFVSHVCVSLWFTTTATTTTTTNTQTHFETVKWIILRKLSASRQHGRFQIQFTGIGSIDMNTYTIQGRFQGFFTATVQHFVANTGGIGIPRNKD